MWSSLSICHLYCVEDAFKGKTPKKAFFNIALKLHVHWFIQYKKTNHLAAGCTSVFSRGTIKPPRQRSTPFFHEVHDELTILWHTPPLVLHPSFCFRCSHISWRHWRERIRAPARSGWVRGHASLPVHGYRMEGKGEPSIQAVHQHLLDAYTRWLDKRLRRYTLQLCFRSSRLRCSPARKPVWMQLHSGTWIAQQTWPWPSQRWVRHRTRPSSSAT